MMTLCFDHGFYIDSAFFFYFLTLTTRTTRMSRHFRRAARNFFLNDYLPRMKSEIGKKKIRNNNNNNNEKENTKQARCEQFILN